MPLSVGENPDRAMVSQAFEDFLDPHLSQAAKAKIAARYGDEVAALAQAVYDDALNAPVDWRTADMNTALQVLHQLLDIKYPWLTLQARRKINFAFIMAWK